MRAVELEDQWLLPFEGLTVQQCRIDAAFGLVIGGAVTEGLYFVRIEGRFEYVAADGQRHCFAPGEHPTSLAPTLALIHASVETSHAYKSGRLVLKFSDGSFLEVEESQGYESWTLNGPSGHST